MAKNLYNPYYDVNQIYNYKGQYDKAKNSGNSQLAQQIASFAQLNYNNLKSNGYEDVAKSLGDVGYSGAKKSGTSMLWKARSPFVHIFTIQSLKQSTE
jgi:hypothetical protein